MVPCVEILTLISYITVCKQLVGQTVELSMKLEAIPIITIARLTFKPTTFRRKGLMIGR